MLNDGRSPGFGLTLVAETVNGFFLSAEMSSSPQGQGDSILPEDLGRNCAMLLLEEVYRVRPALGVCSHRRVCAVGPGGFTLGLGSSSQHSGDLHQLMLQLLSVLQLGGSEFLGNTWEMQTRGAFESRQQ